MKKYILSYKDFLKTSKLQEAVLTPEQDATYSKIQVVKEVKTIHEKIFGDQERIYLPFDPSLFNISLGKSELQETIEELLTSNGYEIISYTQNQCVKIGQKNITKIGKVLVSKNINRKDLADAYGQEVDKLKAVKDSNGLMVVFSRNYDDVASMSTKKAWNSCQNLSADSGYSDYLREYVAKDLEQGSIIAYLIKSTDKEILDPEARILIKPFINVEDEKDIVLLPCTKTYHRGTNEGTPLAYPKFPEFVMSWVKQVQPNINGTYNMQKDVYQDGDTRKIIRKPISIDIEKKQIIENPKTIEDLKLAFDYYDLGLNVEHVEMDSDGLWSYDGDIIMDDMDIIEFPKCFKNLKEVKGDFNLSRIHITSFEGLENLQTIGGDLNCYKTLITSFEGLENLQTIGEHLECSFTQLKSFNGLENLQTIGGGLNCYETSITSFKGLKNLQTIGKDLWCSNTPLETFKGLENLQTIGEGLDCSYTSLKSFTGLERLKIIGGSLRCSFTSLKSFTGLERLQSIGRGLDCCRISLESFEGLENLQTIGGGLYCSYTNIKDFTGFGNLTSIGRDLKCSYTPLQSFKGLESLQSIGKDLNCYNTPLQSFEGLSKDIKINGSIEPKELKDMFYKFKKS